MYEGDLFLLLLLKGNFITVSSVLLRRDVFEQLGGFSTDLRSVEDMDLWLRVAERYPIGLCPEPLVSYRFHPGGMSRNYVVMGRERRRVTARALRLERGRALDWRVRRQVWAQTWQTNGGEAGRAGARWPALLNFARAAAAWPLRAEPYKEAVKVCLNV
jgi:GT2 family glycosyltransferase